MENGRKPMLCLHCSKPGVTRRYRGLCRRCYSAPTVRNNYPLLPLICHNDGGWGAQRRGVYTQDGDGDEGEMGLEAGDLLGSCGEGPPTTALPGTESKILVMAERARRGQELFSHGDADGDS